MAEFNFIDLGQKEYKWCWNYQESLQKEIMDDKLENKTPSAKNYFLLVEHPHVYTLGKSGDARNLLAQEDFLKKINATFFKTDRGGDITYHGPGQIVGYPIFDLEYFRIGVREYIEKMEDAIIETISEYGLLGGRKEGATGVWLDSDHRVRARKICAIGVKVSRGITMHGFALNVNTDLRYFNYINPCGFTTYGVTSIKNELNHDIDMEEVKQLVLANFNKSIQ